MGRQDMSLFLVTVFGSLSFLACNLTFYGILKPNLIIKSKKWNGNA